MCSIIEEERRDAAERAKVEERINTTIEYVNDGFLTPAQAAEKLGMVLDDFLQKFASQLKTNSDNQTV